jgi:polyhydroxyalkanoate synthesis repressor PhaR
MPLRGPVEATMGDQSRTQAGDESTRSERVIKRYSNRKLYDTMDSRYVTLQQIGEMVRRGEHVRIIDNKTKEDKTEVTLALILSEDVRSKPKSVPLGTLRTLIQERGEKLLSQLRDGPIGRFIPGVSEEGEAPVEGAAPAGEPAAATDSPKEEPAAPAAAEAGEKQPSATMAKLQELMETSRRTFEQVQSNLDERIRELVPSIKLIRDLRATVEMLQGRVEQLEQRIVKLMESAKGGGPKH